MNESLRPAGRAQPGVADRLAAGGAKLRQRHVDDQAERRAQRAGDPAQPRRPRVCGGELRLHAATLPRLWCFLNAVMTEWSMTPSPIIFDRPLLRARRRRAERRGASDFLIERIADEMAERLSVVLRQFDLAVDLGTPGEAVRRALAASGKVGAIVAASPFATPAPAGAGGRRRRGGAAVPRRRARSRGVGAVAAIRQRPAGRAGADQARAAAGRPAARRAARRRHADRAAPGVRGGRGGGGGRHLAAGGAVRRPARARRVCCSGRDLRCRSPTSTASPCVTRRRSR